MQRLDPRTTQPPRFMVTLTSKQNNHANKSAKKTGTSRAGYIRDLIDSDIKSCSSKFAFRLRYLSENNQTLTKTFRVHDEMIDWLNAHEYMIVDIGFIRKD